jgi:pimeloyl-ACP methyl ester carboxylesterase
MRRMIGDTRWERLPPSTRAARRAEGAALIADLGAIRLGTASAPPYRFEDLHLPVVAGRGSMSDEHHRQAAEALAAGVAGGELFVVEGAGHGAHHTHPAPFAAFVARAVERAAGQIARPQPLASEP